MAAAGLEEARQAVAQQFRGFARAPFYVNMFHNAGFPEVSAGAWSEGMVDAVAVWGNEAQVTEGLRGMLAMGATGADGLLGGRQR